MRRFPTISLAIGLALAAFCAACASERDPDAVVVGLEGSPSTLDPRFAIDAYATRILPLLFDGLVTVSPDGRVGPGLADSWSIEDGTRYTFRLRDDARFADGSPLTAHDVAENFRDILDPASKCPAASSLDAVASYSAPDERTFVVVLKQPFAPFLMKLTRGIVPAARLGDPDFGERPVGSGPYVVARFERGRAIELAASPHRPGPPPAIARIRFEVIANETTRMLNMKRGAIDLLQNNVPPHAVRYFEGIPGVAVERTPGINYSYLGFHLDDPRAITSRVEVRRAIAHAIDRDAIIATLLLGQARAADSMFAPEMPAHTEVTRYEHDAARAKALLNAAGLPDPDGDGPAPRFRLSYKTSTDRLRNRIADAIAAQLAEVGIAVEKRQFEWGTFFADIQKGNFQTFSLTWVGVIDPDHLFYVFHSSSMPPSGANRGRYRNADVDALLERSRTEPDEAARLDVLREAQRRVADDAVYVGLWWMDNVIVRRERLVGFTPYPGGEYTSLATARLAGGSNP